MITIDGRYTTDMSFWVRFGAAAVDDVVKNIPHVRGLELSGNLTAEDCESISRKSKTLEYLNLLHATFPDNTVPANFMSGADKLDCLRLPQSIISIQENAFADCQRLGDISIYIG